MLNRKELIDKIATTREITKGDAEAALDNVLAGLEAAVIEDGGAKLVGFGTFEVVDRAPRVGRNPQTGDSIEVPAYRTLKFKVGKNVKEKLNED